MTWHLPEVDLRPAPALSSEAAQERGEAVVAAFIDLGVDCALERVVVGPQLLRAEIQPIGKTTMRDFRRLNRVDDIAYALGAESVRIIAPVPGRQVVAVEFPREERQAVELDDLPSTHPPLCVPLGLDTEGDPVLLMIDEAPHVLIAGATGAGKSTCLNAMLVSMIRALTPDELGLVMIDPKMVELRPYAGIPHLVAPVANNVDTALRYLHGLVDTMEDRYEFMAALGSRNLSELNDLLAQAGKLPIQRIVCVVDELAELMMASKKEAEALIVRIAQKGRAAGIHLVVATQSPRVDVVTGLLKINLPTRIAFAVPTMADSRVVIDANGAEALLGKGDGLISLSGLPPVRFQGAYVGDDEIRQACDHWRAQVAEAVAA